MKNILITGHPRSGTHHIARVINAMGYNCTYEKRNLNGFTASWKHIMSGEFEKPCPETNIICNFDKIIHQRRHPLKVISSSLTLWTMSMNYMAKFIDLPDPIINRNNTILNCMITWVEWNKLIEKKAYWGYNIENLQNIQEEWCKQLEIPVQKIPDLWHSNTREHKDLTWDDLRNVSKVWAMLVEEKAHIYGYTT